MTRRALIAFETAGSQIFVEVDEQVLGPERVALRDKAVMSAKVSFNEAISVIRPAAQAILDETAKVRTAPDEVELTLGLKFTASAAVLVASGSSEASCVVKMVWKNTPA
ncbi:CU044_2847 family protein [Sphaerisporangium sp. NPDC005288]|uniref:CU044_2847 family protein n=1 Tax=Sphaerisporangium sp. NPDC005288 TaxID=3155114 RepID=UPI0033B447B1